MNASKSIAASQYPMRATACFDSGLRGDGNLRYHSRKFSPSCKGQPLKNTGAGCESLMQFAAKSRNRKESGFFVGAPVMAALMGGLRPYRFSLRELPGLSHPSALPPDVRVGRQLFNATVEPTMADLFTSAPAQVTPFSFGAHAVRVIDRDGSPWFVAADVCAALGYLNTSKAVADHLDADERYNQSLERGGSLVVISESGLYALVLRSRKPEARKFAKWVTSEVLPAIRKTGGYQQPANIHAAMTAANAVAAQVQAAVFEKLMTGNSRMGNGRWMLSFASGRDNTTMPCVTPIDDDAFVMSLAYLATAIMEPGGMMPSNTDLANLASACNKRLSAQLTYEASRKAVTA